MKKCTKCLVEKDKSEFYLVKRPAPRNPTLYRHCKDCCKIVAKENYSYSRNWELSKKYGVTLREYEQQCQQRDNVCDICQNKTKTMHVDHNHFTGKVRGYLCGSCNRGIGLLKDSSDVCTKAATYLKENGD